MTRKMLIIFSLIGLVVSVGVWAQSYRSVYSSSIGSIGFLLYRGHFSCTKSGPVPPRGGDIMPSSNPEIWSVRVPIWPIAALFAVALPGLALAYRLRRRRCHKMGLCIKCGYDLRGSQERCPECGTPFDETATRPLRLIWIGRTGKAAVWGKVAALSIFAVLGVGMFYLLDWLAKSVLDGDLISYVSAKTGLGESIAISVTIALIVAVSFVCSRVLYTCIAYRRIPSPTNADTPLLESLAGKNSTPQGKAKAALRLSGHWTRRGVR